MKRGREAFVGIDAAKAKNAVSVAEGGRQGEMRYLGEFDTAAVTVAKLVRKLADRYETLHFCYEAGPTGYGLYRQIGAMGHDCTVVAPSMIPRKPGERVKTNRRDARTLARLHRPVNSLRCGCQTRRMRRCGIWCARARRRLRITVASASI